ncbi:hypothetical protein PR048_018399 [Dryococelus australis]|uniref:DDE Tnp4 domain-containing protein n=1 Tax=Dryococelus australis TaxID=614101 RepID=A0ABQ9HC79_9NEOP|nr:hypothetical protein PR048_018399 [Dryococelus australis]
MLSIYLPEPTMQSWLDRTEKFPVKWNFPNAIGSIDGKHVRILCPTKSGPLFFNYKNYYSIVLLAIVDADCKFVAVNVGAYGKESDSQVFQHSVFGKKIRENNFNIPPPTVVKMMKPYSHKTATADECKRIFSYRLCQTRRTSENAFGILGQVFRIFYQPIAIDVAIVDYLIMCRYILHNMIREEYCCTQGTQTPKIKGFQHPQENLIPLRATHARHTANVGERVRKQFTEYFCKNIFFFFIFFKAEHISGIITSTSHDTYTPNGKYRQATATAISQQQIGGRRIAQLTTNHCLRCRNCRCRWRWMKLLCADNIQDTEMELNAGIGDTPRTIFKKTPERRSNTSCHLGMDAVYGAHKVYVVSTPASHQSDPGHGWIQLLLRMNDKKRGRGEWIMAIEN